MQNIIKKIIPMIICSITIITFWKLLNLFAILQGDSSLIDLVLRLIREIYDMSHGWCPKSLDDCEETHKISLFIPAIISNILYIISLLAPFIFTINIYYPLLTKDYSIKSIAQAICTPFIGFIGGILIFFAMLICAIGPYLLFECLHNPIWAVLGIILFLMTTGGGAGSVGIVTTIFILPATLLDD